LAEVPKKKSPEEKITLGCGRGIDGREETAEKRRMAIPTRRIDSASRIQGARGSMVTRGEKK